MIFFYDFRCKMFIRVQNPLGNLQSKQISQHYYSFQKKRKDALDPTCAAVVVHNSSCRPIKGSFEGLLTLTNPYPRTDVSHYSSLKIITTSYFGRLVLAHMHSLYLVGVTVILKDGALEQQYLGRLLLIISCYCGFNQNSASIKVSACNGDFTVLLFQGLTHYYRF